MLTKIIIVVVMLAILGILADGLVSLVRDKGKNNHTVKSLTWRVALSVSLFIFLFLAFKFHWIAPHDMQQQ